MPHATLAPLRAIALAAAAAAAVSGAPTALAQVSAAGPEPPSSGRDVGEGFGESTREWPAASAREDRQRDSVVYRRYDGLDAATTYRYVERYTEDAGGRVALEYTTADGPAGSPLTGYGTVVTEVLPDGSEYRRTVRYRGDGTFLGDRAEFERPLPDTDVRMRTEVNYDLDGEPLPEYFVGFDSAYVDEPRRRLAYRTNLIYEDSTTVPSPLCFSTAEALDSTFPAPGHRREVASTTVYDSDCARFYNNTSYRNTYRGDDGRLERGVDTILGVSYQPERFTIRVDTIVYRLTYTHEDTVTTVLQTTYLSNGATEPDEETILTFDREGRLRSEEVYVDPAVAIAPARLRTLTYGPDSRTQERQSFDAETGEVTGGDITVTYFTRASAVAAAGARAACLRDRRRTPTGVSFVAEAPGAYRAYDMTGRLVAGARARPGDLVAVALPSAGVYAIQGPSGCAEVVAR